MSAVIPRVRMTRDEFLAWDEMQEGRFEYDGDGPVALVGRTRGHAAISRNLLGLLWQALRGRNCQAFGGDLRIEVAAGFRCPDALVTCTDGNPDELSARDPVVVFEVLSPSTAMTDTITKSFEYSAVPSIRRYVMLHQEKVSAIVFQREGGEWAGRVVAGVDVVLDMHEIGVALRQGDLYEGAEFPQASE